MKLKYINAALLLIVTFAAISCADKTIVDTNPERPKYDPSPTVVVERFLRALQQENFKEAYKYSYAPSIDEAGYVIQMRKLYKDNDIRINNFEVIGVQIYEFSSTVAVELDQTLKSPTTGQVTNLNQKSRYSLGLFDKKWKVTGGDCFENCVEEAVPEIEITE
ncbi:MAG: hypothetical protein AAF462_06370 [Thermodesulfobacteriota bacterium]